MPGVAIRFRALTSKALRLEMAPVESQVRGFITAYLETVQGIVSKYPAVPPNSRYKRTGALLAGWHINGRGTFDQTLVASSRAGGASREYAVYVHGDRVGDGQMWYHGAANWKRIADYYDRKNFREGIQSYYNRVRIR